MGNNRPIKTKCWIAYLKSLGFELTRTTGSHYMYVKKGFRTIPVWESEKEIPAMHIRTSCRTIGVDITDVYAWTDANC